MSFGMLLRTVWALVFALAAGLWLLRTVKLPLSAHPLRASNRLRVLLLLVCAFWSLVWLILALIRLPYPMELEWIGGAMADHCRRVLSGQSLYVAPGPGWFPYEYPPLYFTLSALLIRLTGLGPYQAMRLISVGSTLGCAALLTTWVRRLSLPASSLRKEEEASESSLSQRRGLVGVNAGNLWGMICAGLFLAAYRMTGDWYDVERLDMLFLFLSLLGIVWLGESLRATIFSALSLALAFFTKQQAVLFLLGGAAALTWQREWQHLLCFVGISLLACLLPALALNSATHGWFGYYCFKVPLSNGIQVNLARHYLLADLPLYAPVIAVILVALVSRTAFSEPNRSGVRTAVLIAMTLMGVLGSLLSRAHWGGDQNVLISGYLFLGAAACNAGRRLEKARPDTAMPLYLLLLAQLLTLVYRPDAQLPKAANRLAGRRFVAVIHGLEKEGEVLCLDHGGITSPPHFQIMGLMDVLNTQHQTPPTLTAALRAHRFASVVTDALPRPDSRFYGELLRDYAPVECLNFKTTWVVTGYPTPGPDRPVWILRPRRKQAVVGRQ